MVGGGCVSIISIVRTTGVGISREGEWIAGGGV